MSKLTAEKKKKLEDLIGSLRMAEIMNECIWIGDKDHKTIYVNPIFESISGYSLEECLEKDCSFFFDEESKKIIESHHQIRNKGKSSQYESTMISRKGKKIPLLISGSPTNDGGTIGIFTNLTQLKKLSNQKKLSQQIIKNSNEAIVITDNKDKIKLWNFGAKKLFGYSEEEVLNKSISKIHNNNEKIRKSHHLLQEEIEKKGYIHNFEIERKHKDGNTISISLTVRRVNNEKNKTIGYINIYRDITYKKLTDVELQKRFEAMQDAYKELGLYKRQMDYIFELAKCACSNESLENLQKLIVSATCMLTKCDATILRLYKKDHNILTLEQSLGVNQKWLNKNKITFPNSLAEEAIENKRPIIINNIGISQKHQGTNLVKLHNFQTLILVPLFIGEKIIGSLSIYSSDPEKFRFIETDFLQNFGQQISIALNSKLPN